MHRVEDEMQRLRHEFEGYKPSRPYSSSDSRAPIHGSDRYGTFNTHLYLLKAILSKNSVE